MTRAGAAAAIFTALLAAGCGRKTEAPPDPAAERAAATERAKQRAYGGTELKSLEAAKTIGDDINKKAQARDPDSK